MKLKLKSLLNTLLALLGSIFLVIVLSAISIIFGDFFVKHLLAIFISCIAGLAVFIYYLDYSFAKRREMELRGDYKKWK